MAKEIVIFVTAPSTRVAKTIGLKLVEERLAACVNVVPRIDSIYRWGGKVVRDRESLMVIKTVSGRFSKLKNRILRLHPYTVPEIIALPVGQGSAAYLKWIRDMTR
jgi:periplasmic divalent cation tolerance protein